VAGGPETILLAGDEDAVRGLTREVLESFGYHVLEAARPEDAIIQCKEHPGPIHVLLTDVNMPRMSGHVLADHLKTLRPEMRVLYISGYTDDAVRRLDVLEPGMAFLQKPFAPDGLARKVREVLDAHLACPGP
jgi:two-component system, cell cycle sensor histidine kinase and response regulator CckA